MSKVKVDNEMIHSVLEIAVKISVKRFSIEHISHHTYLTYCWDEFAFGSLFTPAGIQILIAVTKTGRVKKAQMDEAQM